jgi:hypothetical protein
MHVFNLILDGLLIGSNVVLGIWATFQVLEAAFPIRSK